MKKIVHMSDLHVGYRNSGDRFRMHIERLKLEKGDDPGNYVILISGDLVDDANNPASYQEVKAGLVDLAAAGFVHTLVVPGNHDYGDGMHGKKKFVAEFKKCFFGKQVTYPKLDIIDDIAFLGLDSMAEELNWYDKLLAQGQLGRRQLRGRGDGLEDVLRRPHVRAASKRVIYLHHHPFDWFPGHGLKDSAGLRRVVVGAVKDGISIDALLYGHNHVGHAHHGGWGVVPRCYDAGTATLKTHSGVGDWFWPPADSTRVIKLDEDPSSDYPWPLF